MFSNLVDMLDERSYLWLTVRHMQPSQVSHVINQIKSDLFQHKKCEKHCKNCFHNKHSCTNSCWQHQWLVSESLKLWRGQNPTLWKYIVSVFVFIPCRGFDVCGNTFVWASLLNGFSFMPTLCSSDLFSPRWDCAYFTSRCMCVPICIYGLKRRVLDTATDELRHFWLVTSQIIPIL